jgi:hypothetical protein
MRYAMWPISRKRWLNCGQVNERLGVGDISKKVIDVTSPFHSLAQILTNKSRKLVLSPDYVNHPFIGNASTAVINVI